MPRSPPEVLQHRPFGEPISYRQWLHGREVIAALPGADVGGPAGLGPATDRQDAAPDLAPAQGRAVRGLGVVGGHAAVWDVPTARFSFKRKCCSILSRRGPSRPDAAGAGGPSLPRRAPTEWEYARSVNRGGPLKRNAMAGSLGEAGHRYAGAFGVSGCMRLRERRGMVGMPPTHFQ